eukprot:CAMPEP_0202028992 /NCGR_PEP_ID=MMETSP0905-20130828/63742_1 /ASSEMBLY_ACC=CAM_ASM_000554 /TAXON_ID=420261 /ORGANISM="Thalassiosira antarctica, Strain CCMP982" /LENGTH=259 /DNA_ID=CAMNT_0048592727 /DNA_START=32 /DNA_END=812 /DNA_ORIENTATION=+
MRTQLRPRAFHHARWMAWAISILLLLTTSSNILASSSSEEIIAAPSLEYDGKHAPPTTPAPTATQPPTPATGAPTTTPATSKDPRVPAASPAIPALPQTIPRAAPTTHPARIVHRVRGGATGVRRTRRAMLSDRCMGVLLGPIVIRLERADPLTWQALSWRHQCRCMGVLLGPIVIRTAAINNISANRMGEKKRQNMASIHHQLTSLAISLSLISSPSSIAMILGPRERGEPGLPLSAINDLSKPFNKPKNQKFAQRSS